MFKRLLLAILMHATSTGFLGFFISTAITPENRAIIYIVNRFVLWIPVVAVILKFAKNLKT